MLVAIDKCTSLPEKTHCCLISLGRTLGKFDLQGQMKGMDTVIAECERELSKLQNNKEERLRSYQTLGLCAGAGLAILFI
jgi:stage III sporulation protein AB